MKIDSKEPKIKFEEYASLEARFTMLLKSNPEEAKRLMALAQEDTRTRWKLLQRLVRTWKKPYENATDSTSTWWNTAWG